MTGAGAAPPGAPLGYHVAVLEPCLAPVRPRVRRPRGDEVMLDEVVADALARSDRVWFALRGPPGAGKSAALAHLAARFAGESRLILLDGDHLRTAPGPRWPPVVVSVGPRGRTRPIGLELVPWAEDDCIEYLLARHPDRCGAVVERLRAARDLPLLEGLPLLLAPVLDAFAADDALADCRSALRSIVAAQVASAAEHAEVQRACGERLLRSARTSAAAFGRDRALDRLAAMYVVQVVVTADAVVGDLLATPPRLDWLTEPWPVGLVRQAGARLRHRRQAHAALRAVLREGPDEAVPRAAALLVAAGAPWMPAAGERKRFANAYLAGACWMDADLVGADCTRADLRAALLADADCTRIKLARADLTGADCEGATFDWAEGDGARFVRAKLPAIHAISARFRGADFSRATLEGASLPHADLLRCDFRRACLDRSDLREAELRQTRLSGATFRGADLRGAFLSRCSFRDVELHGCRMEGASLFESDWVGVRVEGARLDEAGLQRADLTGAAFPAARLRGATLFGARLADVDLSRADLRGADLRSASFQMGSSRSGLVGSPIAREGSLTGFYTEDLRETAQLFPEEVRKADLSGCDLRGARLDGTDFYLVDLRGALYDDEQADYLRRCGAILDAIASPP